MISDNETYCHVVSVFPMVVWWNVPAGHQKQITSMYLLRIQCEMSNYYSKWILSNYWTSVLMQRTLNCKTKKLRLLPKQVKEKCPPQQRDTTDIYHRLKTVNLRNLNYWRYAHISPDWHRLDWLIGAREVTGYVANIHYMLHNWASIECQSYLP